MRVLERGPGGNPVVFEDQDRLEPRVLLEVEHALPERPQHALDGDYGQRRERLPVLGRLDDHLVRADAAHLVEQALALAIERALHLQRRKLVRDDADVPPGAVGPSAAPVAQHLARRVRLVALAERAEHGGLEGPVLQTEVARALPSLGGDDHPAAGDGVLPQLRHAAPGGTERKWTAADGRRTGKSCRSALLVSAARAASPLAAQHLLSHAHDDLAALRAGKIRGRSRVPRTASPRVP